jgi:hypothetical protein
MNPASLGLLSVGAAHEKPRERSKSRLGALKCGRPWAKMPQRLARTLAAGISMMLELDYFKLDRAVQDRFADATRGLGVPLPLARLASRDRWPLLWFGLAAASALATGYGTTIGVGDLDNPIALAPFWVLGVFTLGVAASVFFLLFGLGRQHRRRSMPFVPGLFLFPVGVLDARGDVLQVARLPEITGVRADGSHVVVVAEGGAAWSFPTEDEATAEAVCRAVDEARGHYRHAIETQNRRELALLDPLMDSGFSSPFSPKVPLARHRPVWQRFAPLLALAFGGCVAIGIWIVRNRLSERALYAAATGADTVEAYDRYLERGGPRAEVRDVLRPRAELRRVEAKGSVESLEGYLEKHSESVIRGEIHAALRRALEGELEEAKAKGTVTALREYRERRSRHAYLEEPIAAALDALYAEALAGYVAVANPRVDGGRKLIERLLGHSRQNGPRVEVRFVRSLPSSIEKADSVVRRSLYFMGQRSVPSQYFDDAHSARREAEILPELLKRLQEPFPKDILEFVAGEAAPIVEDRADLPTPEVPTIFISSDVHLSGGYLSEKPRGVFVGVGMKFRIACALPGEPVGPEFESSTWRTPNPQILREEGKGFADVYEAMTEVGYERLKRRFLSYFFAEAE